MKLTTTILILFVCFGCSQKSRNIYWIISGSDTIIVDADKNIVDVSKAKTSTGGKINDSVVAIRFGIPKSNGVTHANYILIPMDAKVANDTDKPAKKSSTNNITVDGTGRIFIGFNNSSTHPEYDTQKVIMLVCDTTVDDSQGGNMFYMDSITQKPVLGYIWLRQYDTKPYWQYGYTLNDVEYYNGTRMVATESNKYLDADKKPLSKSIIVWQTKELK